MVITSIDGTRQLDRMILRILAVGRPSKSKGLLSLSGHSHQRRLLETTVQPFNCSCIPLLIVTWTSPARPSCA